MNDSKTTVNGLCQYLDQFAPTRLAEEWDNVGLLAGDRQSACERVMTCLTITPESVEEAVEERANLIVTHHPLPFHPFRQLTTDTVPSRMLWNLAKADIAIYSPHTGFDSAIEGINFALATKLGLKNIQPLVPLPDETENIGTGRVGTPTSPLNLNEFIENAKRAFNMDTIKFVGDPSDTISKAAVACGSGESFLGQAIEAGCDLFVTGETDFHTCLEARAHDVALLLLGHYNSERFAVEQLADRLANSFPNLTVWPSRRESDPTSFA